MGSRHRTVSRWVVLILAIETATERIGVGLIGTDGMLASFEAIRSRHHAEIVVPAIEFVCRQADVTVDELSAVAVDVGPGLFTGMRVGLATAKAMAQALDVPVIGVMSLEVLAYSCRHSDKIVVSVVDARKGQVFFGFHRAIRDRGHSVSIQALGEPQVGRVEDLIGAIEDRGQEVICVGDGAIRYMDDLANLAHVEISDRYSAHPSIDHLAIMAMRRAVEERWSDAREVQAMYLRAPDVEINWSTRMSPPAAEVSS